MQYKSLQLDMIEEGGLMDDLENAFEDIQQKLCEYRDKYGMRADGAKSVLTMKLEVKCQQSKDDMDAIYLVKADIKSNWPTRPPKSTMAIQSVDDNGQARLFARDTGTTDGDPRQAVMFKQNGDVAADEKTITKIGG